MEQNKNPELEVIDLRLVVKKLWSKRGLFLRAIGQLWARSGAL